MLKGTFESGSVQFHALLGTNEEHPITEGGDSDSEFHIGDDREINIVPVKRA